MARLLLVAFTVASLAVASSAHAATTTLQVVAVGGGDVSVTPGPIDPNANCASPLSGDRTAITSCVLTYEAGTPVRLAATGLPANGGPATSLGQWSDERCPPAPSCTFAVGPDRQSVAAVFTPQRVSVLVSGAGSVSSPQGDLVADGGGPCTSDGSVLLTCFGDFPLGTTVGLTPDPAATATWAPKALQAARPLCNSEQPPPCELTADRPRWASVGFGVAPENSQIPPEVTVAFQIRKAGSGSGTVRSDSINCGSQCASDRTFGARETLVADPDAGSRFDRWGAACGTAPRCNLAVGPITALTAVFERGAATGGQRPQGGGSTNRALQARVLRLNVRGHGRKRAILIRLRLNAASAVRAVLLRGRRQVAAKRFRVPAGTHLLRFRVPVRARPGLYRLRLTIQGNGQTKRLTRRVRLHR